MPARKNRGLRFSKGDANKIVDIILHPYFDNAAVIVLDGIVHAVIENNPKQSFGKFLRYNVLPMVKGKRR